jgi:hypothetical protein
MGWPGLSPITAQHAEQLRRQHDIPIPAALALFDPDQHAAAVDIGDLQPHRLRYPEPGGVGGHQLLYSRSMMIARGVLARLLYPTLLS